MISNQTYQIFKQASVTYFNASLFFPHQIKVDVFKLYAFVRMADDFVDDQPQDKTGFYEFKDQYQQAVKGKAVDNQIISQFAELAVRKKFNADWITAFLDVMESDLTTQKCKTLNDTIKYMYGSAEVIGLMLNRIMDLPTKADHPAQMLGRSMQYANFIRDIDEDLKLGRQYLPDEELKKYSLPNLSQKTAEKYPKKFNEFMHAQIDYYNDWKSQAELGFQFIPKRCLIPIQTASQMYTWTLKKISHHPTIVYQQKIKPSKFRVFGSILGNTVQSML